MSPPQAPQWDETLEPLMKHFISKKEVKIKHAVEGGRRTVEYFRGREYFKWVSENEDKLRQKFPAAFEGIEVGTPRVPDRLGDKLMRKGFIFQASYQPLTDADAEGDQLKRPRWPKRLRLNPSRNFDENEFYILGYEGNRTWMYIWLFVLVAVVLLICLFPAWPLSVKIGLWYVLFIFLCSILFLVFARLVVFVMFWFFGFDFWILPNFFNDDAGFFESFKPALFYEWRNDNWFMFASRIMCACLTAIALYQLNQTHSVSDVQHFAKQSFIDVLAWGQNYLEAIPAPQQKYPSLEDFEQHSARTAAEEEAAKAQGSSGNGEGEEEQDL